MAPKHGQRSRGRLAKIFVDQMVEYTECEVEELINLMENSNELKKRVLEYRARSLTLQVSGNIYNYPMFILKFYFIFIIYNSTSILKNVPSIPTFHH